MTRDLHASPDRPVRIDAHVHIRDAAAVDDIVAAGVAAVRDAGTSAGTALLLRRERGPAGHPVVVTAGRALVRKGGYGSLLGIAVETPEEIERAVAELARDGADIIKAVASGSVSLKRPGTITAGGFGGGELRRIVDAARRSGLAVMAHANGEAALRNAADAGVLSIEHGFFMTEEVLRTMADRRIFWVPTAGALHRAADRPEVTAAARAFIGGVIGQHLAMIGRAYRLGVPLAVGTDAVLPDRRYGSHYESELAYLRQAGIPADDVERIASVNGRTLLGI